MSLLVVIGFRNYNLLRDEAYIMLQAVGLSKLQKSSGNISRQMDDSAGTIMNEQDVGGLSGRASSVCRGPRTLYRLRYPSICREPGLTGFSPRWGRYSGYPESC